MLRQALTISIEAHKNYLFEKIDICDEKNIASCLLRHRPDVIIHLAAETHVDRSISGPNDFIRTNIDVRSKCCSKLEILGSPKRPKAFDFIIYLQTKSSGRLNWIAI